MNTKSTNKVPRITGLLILEVRKSNANAISFYRGFRFNTVGERASYYSNPVEDAYVMQRDLRY